MYDLSALRKRLLIASLVALSLFIVAGSVYAQDGIRNPEVAVLPSTLERISWGGIIAGTIIAIVIQLAGNLLSIGLGVSRINPNPRRGEDAPSVEDIGTSTIVMMAVTVLISLFIGGYVASRFAGSPDRGDALLNGLMVWGLDTVITLFLLTSTLGTVFSGLSALLGHGVRLIGSTTSAVAQGVGAVAQGAGAVAQGALQAAGNVASSAAGAVGDVAHDAVNRAEDAAQNAIRSNPDLQRLAREQDTIVQRIQDEAMKLISQAGVDPNQIKDQAEGAVQEAQNTVKDAAQRVQQNPAQAQQIVTDTLNRLFQRGTQVAGQVTDQVSQVDRDKLIDVMAQRGNMSREQAQQQLAKWEGEYNRIRQQGEQTLQQVRQQGEQALQQARQQADRVQAEAREKIEQARRDAERTAREAAEATTKIISRLALAGFAAIVIGGVAAGIGGIVGAPDTIPTAEIADSNNDDDDNIPPTVVVATPVATTAP